MKTLKDCDAFTRAYIRTALWSSTAPKFGECPKCKKVAILNCFPEEGLESVAVCGSPECGKWGIPNEEPMDANYSETDLAPETLEKIIADCAGFQAKHGDVIRAAIATGEVTCGPDFDEWGHAGHDFWLTRNGHGVGFWDGDWPEPFADELTKAAEAFGECYLYVGDDGRIYA